MKMNVSIMLLYILCKLYADNNVYNILGEALNRIKTTFIVDKSPHTEIEIHQKSSYMNQLSMKSFKKKAIPSTNSYRTQSTENFNRKYMAIKALYNAKA